MRKCSPLDALLPRTRQGILAATLTRPEKAWFASEIARRMGVPSSSLQRELKGLAAAGIIKGHRQGRMAYYQANVESPLFPDLRGLILKTVGLRDVLVDALAPLESKLNLALVYGSIASKEERSDSDVDLLVVGSAQPAELALPLRGARELLGRIVNPKVYAALEFRKKRAARDHFLTHVLDKPLLFVIGNRNDLAKAPLR